MIYIFRTINRSIIQDTRLLKKYPDDSDYSTEYTFIEADRIQDVINKLAFVLNLDVKCLKKEKYYIMYKTNIDKEKYKNTGYRYRYGVVAHLIKKRSILSEENGMVLIKDWGMIPRNVIF